MSSAPSDEGSGLSFVIVLKTNQEHQKDINAKQDQQAAGQEELKRHDSQPTDIGGLPRQTGSLPKRIEK
jgi:hypothetical protein